MKKIAIFKIVVFSVLAVFLIAILISGLSKNNFLHISFVGIGNGFRYSNASKYTIAKENVDINSLDIDEIEVNWLGGKILFEENTEEKINFYEEYDSDIIKDEDYLMRYLVQDNKLIIQFCKPMWNVKRKVRDGKNIFVKLPSKIYNRLEVSSVNGDVNLNLNKDIQSQLLKIDTVSGDIDIRNANMQKVKIDTVSGEVKTSNVNVETTMDINTVSGNMTLSETTTNILSIDAVSGKLMMNNGSFSSLDVNTVSGDITLLLNKAPLKINCDTVSGDVRLAIPENDGFRAELDTVSGELQCGFASVYKKGVVYKDGSAIYDFNSTSGDVTIERSDTIQ